MKKQQKQLIILLVVLVALAAGFFGLKQYNQLQSEKPEEDEDITVVNLDRDSIVRFSYDNEGETYAFEKEGDTWYYTEDHSLTLNQNRITAMLAKVCPLTASQAIENVTDMTQYGLDQPAKTIQYETENESVILYVGDYNSVAKIHYLCKPSETTVYTVDGQSVNIFDNTLEDLIEEPDETEAVDEITSEATSTEGNVDQAMSTESTEVK